MNRFEEKSHRNKLLEIDGRRTFIGTGERRRDFKKSWEVIRSQVLKHFQRAREGKPGGSKLDIKKGATAIETMK